MKDLDNIYTYHKPSKDQPLKYLAIRTYARQLAAVIEDVCPDGREKSIAHTNLEQATMWANAAIARNEGKEPEPEPETETEPKRLTNFERITKSPEVLAERLMAEFDICPPDMNGEDCNKRGTCDGCWLEWLGKEAAPDD